MPHTVPAVAGVLRAAGDPARLRILALLRRGPLCVCQLVGALGLAQSAVSKHVALLRRAGLIAGTREGKWLVCRLDLGGLPAPVGGAVRALLVPLERDPDVRRGLVGAARGTLPGVPAECRLGRRPGRR